MSQVQIVCKLDGYWPRPRVQQEPSLTAQWPRSNQQLSREPRWAPSRSVWVVVARATAVISRRILHGGGVTVLYCTRGNEAKNNNGANNGTNNSKYYPLYTGVHSSGRVSRATFSCIHVTVITPHLLALLKSVFMQSQRPIWTLLGRPPTLPTCQFSFLFAQQFSLTICYHRCCCRCCRWRLTGGKCAASEARPAREDVRGDHAGEEAAPDSCGDEGRNPGRCSSSSNSWAGKHAVSRQGTARGAAEKEYVQSNNQSINQSINQSFIYTHNAHESGTR